MRMKERGLGTGAIVAIVVGIVVGTVVPVTIAAVLLSGGGGGGTGGSGTGGSIVGTWQDTSQAHYGDTFVFKSGGTYDWTSGTTGSQQSGSWSMSGDILTLDSYQFKVVFGTNSMQWYEKDPYTNDWMTDPSRSFTKVT